MGKITKSFVILLIGIMAISCISLLTIKFATAQATHRPSVPEFTAKLTESSLEVTIKNQPLMEVDDISGNNINLYYGFRFKDPNSMPGHWAYAPIYFVGLSSYGTYYEASDVDYTIISFQLDDYPFDGTNHRTGINRNGPIDVQVIALIGIEVPTDQQDGKVYRFDGVTSDWSNTQTIIIPTSFPTVPENALTAPSMVIITPMPVTYQNSSVPLFFGANILTGSPEIISLSYSLDGNQNITITIVGKTGLQHFDSQTGYTYHTNSTLMLDNLANGNHTLWVYSHDAVGNEMSESVQFTVDAPIENSPKPTEPFPVLPVLVTILSVIVISIMVAFLVKLKKKENIGDRA